MTQKIELPDDNWGDIKKGVRIQDDGKQFLIRIPKEVSRFLKLKKGDKFIFIVQISPKGKLGLFFEIDREKHEKDKKLKSKAEKK